MNSQNGVSVAETSRLGGECVRYKAKLVGMDQVPSAQADEMCWTSMKKLKAAAKRQGKQKVWIQISHRDLKVLDKKTESVLYDHDMSRIRFLRTDGYEPRALAYIYQNEDTYLLFYFKMTNQRSSEVMDTFYFDPICLPVTWNHGLSTDDDCFCCEPSDSTDTDCCDCVGDFIDCFGE